MKPYSLPPALTKPTDTRSAAFVARHGDVAVELDALPADILRDRVEGEVKARMDLNALSSVWHLEEAERTKLVELLAKA